ncbi:hypothetical protein HY990_03110 [Candidatus Micrarchaeota archaeon]|nr:hypothetical protein [Candidatus Micrarchaeota archaeon]
MVGPFELDPRDLRIQQNEQQQALGNVRRQLGALNPAEQATVMGACNFYMQNHGGASENQLAAEAIRAIGRMRDVGNAFGGHTERRDARLNEAVHNIERHELERMGVHTQSHHTNTSIGVALMVASPEHAAATLEEVGRVNAGIGRPFTETEGNLVFVRAMRRSVTEHPERGLGPTGDTFSTIRANIENSELAAYNRATGGTASGITGSIAAVAGNIGTIDLGQSIENAIRSAPTNDVPQIALAQVNQAEQNGSISGQRANEIRERIRDIAYLENIGRSDPSRLNI